MEEDLILLSTKIKKDPLTYKDEYLNQLKTLQSLLNLPTPPIRQIQPMIFFIVNHCLVEPERSLKILVDSLEIIQENKTKRVILNGLVLVRQKQLIGSKELLRLIIKHGNDLNYFLDGVQGFIDEECYEVLVEWYKKGTERQRGFSYYLMIVLFSKLKKPIEDREAIDNNNSREAINNDSEAVDNNKETMTGVSGYSCRDTLENLICDGLFLTGKQCKTCCLYFLNKTEQEFDISKLKRGEEYGRRLFRDLSEVMDRDIKIMKMRIFVLFKKHFKIRKSILGIVMKMIDLEKEDLKEILECLAESVEMDEAQETVESIRRNFLDEGRGEEIVVLGMNVMREIYSRVAGINTSDEVDDGICDGICDELYDEICDEICDEVDDEICDESDCRGEERSSSLCEDNELSDEMYDESDCRGEERSSLASQSVSQDEEDQKKEELKNKILDLVKPFHGNRSKAIFYAYKNIIKVLIHNKTVDRAISHIKKKTLKEEKLIKRSRGREEMKRLREETKREEKQDKYKNKTKGRKRTAMLKYMMRPNKKKTNRKK